MDVSAAHGAFEFLATFPRSVSSICTTRRHGGLRRAKTPIIYYSCESLVMQRVDGDSRGSVDGVPSGILAACLRRPTTSHRESGGFVTCAGNRWAQPSPRPDKKLVSHKASWPRPAASAARRYRVWSRAQARSAPIASGISQPHVAPIQPRCSPRRSPRLTTRSRPTLTSPLHP